MLTATQTRALKTSPEEIEQLRREFLQEVEPWVRLKIDVLACAKPKYRIYPDGNFDVEYDEESRRLMDECDKGIKEIEQRYVKRHPDRSP